MRCRVRSTTGAVGGRAGSTGANRRSGACVLRASRRRSRRDGRDRAERLDVRGSGRRVDSGRIAGPRARRRVHLAPLPVPGPGAPRRDGSARRGAELAGAIGPDVDVVAFSAVQMATGEVADLDAIASAAAEHGALTVVDATQAAGWLPLDATRFDVVVAHAYKWLMSPRGTAFMAIRGDRTGTVVPHAAGWYAGDDPLQTFFGGPLRLAESARRLDTSPAWFMWVATAPALALIERIGIEAIHEHDVALANRFRAGLGLEPSDSAIVMSRCARCGREARASRDQGRRPRRAPAHVVARLQHGRGRRPDARRAPSLSAQPRAARPSCRA